jgi:hypothetical protein
MSVPVKMIFTAVFCAASVGLMALSPSAIAQQKTVKQCNDDWVADRVAIQASGKTKPMFLAECRGLPVPARTPGTAALAQGQYANESEAKASCPNDAVVWVNLRSKVYHASGTRNYGRTQQGAYMCEQQSLTAGYHAPRNRTTGATSGGAVGTAKDGAT